MLTLCSCSTEKCDIPFPFPYLKSFNMRSPHELWLKETHQNSWSHLIKTHHHSCLHHTKKVKKHNPGEWNPDCCKTCSTSCSNVWRTLTFKRLQMIRSGIPPHLLFVATDSHHCVWMSDLLKYTFKGSQNDGVWGSWGDLAWWTAHVHIYTDGTRTGGALRPSRDLG